MDGFSPLMEGGHLSLLKLILFYIPAPLTCLRGPPPDGHVRALDHLNAVTRDTHMASRQRAGVQLPRVQGFPKDERCRQKSEKKNKAETKMDTDHSSGLDWPLYCGKRGIMFASNFLVACVIYVFWALPNSKMSLCVITL